jgi:hypothetical protein
MKSERHTNGVTNFSEDEVSTSGIGSKKDLARRRHGPGPLNLFYYRGSTLDHAPRVAVLLTWNFPNQSIVRARKQILAIGRES